MEVLLVPEEQKHTYKNKHKNFQDCKIRITKWGIGILFVLCRYVEEWKATFNLRIRVLQMD